MKIRGIILLCAVLCVSAGAMWPTRPGKTQEREEKGIWRHLERQAPSREVLSLFALPDNRIVVGTSHSLHVYDRDRWKKQSFNPSILLNHSPFFVDSAGRLYFNNDNRLSVWSGGEMIRYDAVEIYDPLSAAENADGNVLIGSYHVNVSGLISFDGKNARKLYGGRVRSLTVDTTGKIWMTALPSGDSTQRLIAGDGMEWIDRTAEIGGILPVSGNNLMVQAAPDGAVWVSNEGSYGIYRNGAWTLRRNPGGGTPVALAFDRKGQVWGYSHRTLYLLDKTGAWKMSRTYQSYLANYPGFLAVASDSAVYTYDDQILYRLNGAAWEPVDVRNDLGSDMVTCMAYLDDGRLLCGHGIRGLPYSSQQHRGLSIFNGVNWTNITEIGKDAPLTDVFILKKSPDENVFIYSNSGYYFYDGITFNTLDSLEIFDVTDVEWDIGERMWLATGKGLVRYRNPDYSLYIPPSSVNYWGGVFNLSIDEDDNLYMMSVAPDGRGPIIYTDQVRWYHLIQNSGGTILDFEAQPDGKIWAARIADLSWWDAAEKEWMPVADFPDSNRFVHIDAEGRIWASSFGKTGYYKDGAFHVIPELSGIAANTITLSGNGRIAVNAFNREHSEFYGLYEYDPVPPVKVAEPDRPHSFLNVTAYPNPFNPSVTIQFELQGPEKVEIVIYNIAGQRIRTLANHLFPAGVNRIIWDASTESGERIASGVYFYRAEAGKKARTGKLLLLR